MNIKYLLKISSDPNLYGNYIPNQLQIRSSEDGIKYIDIHQSHLCSQVLSKLRTEHSYYVKREENYLTVKRKNIYCLARKSFNPELKTSINCG